MNRTSRRGISLAVLLVGLTSWAAFVLPSFSDQNIAAGISISPARPKVIEIRASRRGGEDVTIADHRESYSRLCSSTIRTARSRTSGEYLLDLAMTPSSQEMQSLAIPRRLTHTPRGCYVNHSHDQFHDAILTTLDKGMGVSGQTPGGAVTAILREVMTAT